MTNPDGYVHKLRLEALDGANVDIAPDVPIESRTFATAWMITKFVWLSIALSSLLILLAREIAG